MHQVLHGIVNAPQIVCPCVFCGAGSTSHFALVQNLYLNYLFIYFSSLIADGANQRATVAHGGSFVVPNFLSMWLIDVIYIYIYNKLFHLIIQRIIVTKMNILLTAAPVREDPFWHENASCFDL